MHQLLSKDPSALEFLMDPDCSNTDNSNETLKTLMITLKKFCGVLENSSDVSIIIQRSLLSWVLNESYNESSNEMLKILIIIHFPDCNDESKEKSEPEKVNLQFS